MKRTPGKTFEERQKYWTKIIEEARKFPSGVNAYCTENGISTNNYYSWFKKLRVSHPEWMDSANSRQSLGNKHAKDETKKVKSHPPK